MILANSYRKNLPIFSNSKTLYCIDVSKLKESRVPVDYLFRKIVHFTQHNFHIKIGNLTSLAKSETSTFLRIETQGETEDLLLSDIMSKFMVTIRVNNTQIVRIFYGSPFLKSPSIPPNNNFAFNIPTSLHG